ncbi:MAG: hypothetical protein QOD03_372 [Verrucomicrobiota bacterium]|jgi:hypothetical protein
MKRETKLNSEQQQEQTAQHQSQQKPVTEFATMEEMLRFDTAQTPVPTGIAERLQRSSADCPKPSRSWWQRLFERY